MDYPFFFTWSAQNAVKPVELTGGEGAWFTTADGGRWLDLGSLSYQVNAGHGINYVNIAEVRTLPHLHELNIGHSIISRAITIGLPAAVKEMLSQMESYRG